MSYTNGSYVGSALVRRPRAIDIYFPDCAVEELHHDVLDITNHPVEQGATISDHAFKQPAEVTLHWSWSNSSPQSTGESWDQQTYAALLNLQASRNLFTLITGKRSYNNMLLAEISVTVDNTSEYTLVTNMVLKQLIIVQTAAASAGVQNANQTLQTDAPTTAPTQPTGQQQAIPQANPPAAVTSAATAQT